MGSVNFKDIKYYSASFQKFMYDSTTDSKIPLKIMQPSNNVFPEIDPAEEIDEADKREILKENNKFPYCCLGCIKFSFDKNNELYGTGVLISSNLVLTCAHNVYSRQKKIQAIQIEFQPARQGKLVVKAKVKRFYFPEEYKGLNQKRYDYAILELEQDFEEYGSLGVCCSKEYQKKATQVTIAGYPIDRNSKLIHNKSFDQMYLFSMSGQIISHQPGKFTYNIETSAGQSGSPIFIHNQGHYFIIGIHTQGGGKHHSEGVTLAQDHFITNLKKWASPKKQTLNLQPLKKEVTVKLIQEMTIKNNWQYLHELNLTFCELSNASLAELMRSRWRSLARLFLNHNNLTKLVVEGVHLKRLVTLEADHNKISRIDDSLSNLTYLSELSLAHNSLKDIEVAANIASLTRIKLNQNEQILSNQVSQQCLQTLKNRGVLIIIQ